MDPVVDVHAHAMPMPVLTWLEQRGLADLGAVAEAVVRLDPVVSGVGSGAPLPCATSMHDPALRLEEMARTGVTHEVVSLPPFLMAATCLDEALVGEVVARGNDALAEYCAHDREHLVPIGVVPLGWPGAAAEAVRCLDELGMSGLALGSAGAGQELDHPAHHELWRLLAERGVPAFLHPSGVPGGARLADFWLPQLLGYPMETAIAVARLLFGGVLETHRFPLVLAHGGGCLSAVRGRLDMGWDRKPVARTTGVPPTELLDRLYYDSAVFDPVALRRLVEDVGADRVLLGTDHPFDLAERDPVGFVSTAGLPAEAVPLILGRTAASLFLEPDRPRT